MIIIRRSLESPYALLNVSDQKRRSSQIVDWTIKETLNFLLMEIHCDDVIHSSLA